MIAKQIAFNCVPQIDSFEDNGYTREEMKMVWETRKILGEPHIRVNPTAVRVPVFFGHSRGGARGDAPQDHRCCSAGTACKGPRGEVMDERRPGGYPTAAIEAANRDTVYVGRIREDMSHRAGIDLWIVADNVRKGAATNSVQIAEILVREYL